MEQILNVINVSKKFNNIQVLNNINFSLDEGEIYAFLGRNATGKTTLMKILSGVYQPDSGAIYLYGKRVCIKNPYEAVKSGIRMIYQDINLFDTLTIAENICFESIEDSRFGIINKKKMLEEAQAICDSIDFNIDCNKKVEMLGMGEKQFVALARTLKQKFRILIMDEPTVALTIEECNKLFKAVCKIKEMGISVIYITHNINEIFKVADRVSVLRDGEIVMTQDVSDVKTHDLIFSMIGREMKRRYPKLPVTKAKEILRLEHVCKKNIIEDINFGLRGGEILGITGLIGSGRTAIAKTIFGELPDYSGSIYFKGKKVRIKSPVDAIKYGICHLPEDRINDGLLQFRRISDNVTIANLNGVENERLRWMIDKRIEKSRVHEYVERLGIRCSDENQKVEDLSGGNQQKVLIARWLLAYSSILIFDEPTKGLDIISKVEVYNIMNELAREGKGIIFISSDFSEVIGMCDRILVISNGRISKELNREEATQEMILQYASINS